MAIKDPQFNAHPAPSNEQETIRTLVASLEQIVIGTNLSDERIMEICESTIYFLVHTQVPITPIEIKEVRPFFMKASELLELIINRSNDPKQMLLYCLQKIYQTLIVTDKPSLAGGVIFNIETLPEAIRYLMKNSLNAESDENIKHVLFILCSWLRQSIGFTNMNKCIIEMFNGLEDMKKFGLLLEIAIEVIEQLFISMVIPFIRPNTLPVLIHILAMARSRDVLMKIWQRIPAILKRVCEEYSGKEIHPDIQKIIDSICLLIELFPIHNEHTPAVHKFLMEFPPSPEFRMLYSVNTWHVERSIKLRNPKMPIGLINMGNTCYMNSVLQALFLTKTFTNDLLEINVPSRMIQTIQELFAMLLSSVRSELVPRDALSTCPSTFRYGFQQDSFEYLGYVIDQIHEEEKKYLSSLNQSDDQIKTNGHNESIWSVKKEVCDEMDWDEATPIAESNKNDLSLFNTSSISTETSTSTNGHSSDSDKKEPPELPKTLVQRAFGGRMSVTYKCLECSNVSSNIDNFFDLQLSLPQNVDNFVFSKNTNCTTQSLLDSYFHTEKMIDDDKYYCEKCGKCCDGERNIHIENGPTNLIMVIKHFKYDRKFNIRRKLLQKIHHNETVTMQTKSTTNDQASLLLTYKLYAMVVHCGMSMDSGHYYTFGADPNDNWFKFNDSFVSESSWNEIRNLNETNTPYILFYELVDSQPIDENGVESIEQTKTINHVSRNGEYLDWSQMYHLPPSLIEYVQRDNFIFKNESKRRNYDDDNVIRYGNNKYRKSDNDQDPPSSCGGNMIGSSNRYIC